MKSHGGGGKNLLASEIASIAEIQRKAKVISRGPMSWGSVHPGPSVFRPRQRACHQAEHLADRVVSAYYLGSSLRVQWMTHWEASGEKLEESRTRARPLLRQGICESHSGIRQAGKANLGCGPSSISTATFLPRSYDRFSGSRLPQTWRRFHTGSSWTYRPR